MSRRLTLLLTLVWSLGVAGTASALEVPKHWGKRVVDIADVVSEGAEQALEDRLARLERETGAQVAVLTIPSLDGEVLEDFSLRVVETWKLGQKDVDDGALFLIVRDDRRLRIEVGYGLEGVIPDILAGRILNDVVLPRFRAGEFDAGVANGVGAIAALAEGREGAEVLPPPRQRRDGVRWPVIFFIIVVIIILEIRSRRGGGGGHHGRRGGGMIFFPGGGGRRSGGFGGGGGFGGFSGGGGSFGGGGASSSW